MSSFRFWVWAYWVILFSTFLHCRRRTTGNLVWIFIVTLERIIKMKLQIMDPFYKVAALCLYDLIPYTHFSSAMHTFICVVSHRIHYAVQLRCHLRLLIMRFKEQTWRILRVIKLIYSDYEHWWNWLVCWLAGCRVGNIKKSVSFVLHCAVVRSHSVTLIQFISVSLNGRTLCHATNIVENLDSLLIIIITIVMMMMVMHKHIHCNLELH